MSDLNNGNMMIYETLQESQTFDSPPKQFQPNTKVKIKNLGFNNISAIYQQKSNYHRPYPHPNPPKLANGSKLNRNKVMNRFN